MLKDVDIHSISPDLGYPSAQTFNQRHPENLGKPPHAKTMNPEQQSIDVGGCESSNVYQILESKDIKRHVDQTCWNFGLLKKTCPIQYLATMTKKMILSASRL